MLKQTGLVSRKRENGMAWVVTDSKNACGECSSARGCRSCLSRGKIVSMVRNEVGAEPGDLVEIHVDKAGLFKGAAMFYLFPILVLIFFAFVGAAAGELAGMSETAGAISFGLGGFAAALAVTVRVSNSGTFSRSLTPEIHRIVERAGARD